MATYVSILRKLNSRRFYNEALPTSNLKSRSALVSLPKSPKFAVIFTKKKKENKMKTETLLVYKNELRLGHKEF